MHNHLSMKSWELFEQEVFKYLRRRFSLDGAIDFVQLGGSNSSILDIQAVGKSGNTILLEVKSSLAQAGQFVLEVKNSQFHFRPRAKGRVATSLQLELIKYMNQHFGRFQEVTQSAVEIDWPRELTNQLVQEHYRSKGAAYFVSGSIEGDSKFGIVPLTHIGEAFTFKVILRRKKSGTNSLPLRLLNNELEKIVRLKCQNLGITLSHFENNQTRIQLRTSCLTRMTGHKMGIEHEGRSYYLSQSSSDLGLLELKAKSSTNNINIIYAAEYLFVDRPEWTKQFEKDLLEL